MSYRSILHSVSGQDVGLFRPRAASGPVALLLGRTPENWYGGNESAQARAMVGKGYWVVTIDTPNWGNQTDLDNINAALAWAETTWGRDIGRLVIVAHGKGAVAALHFSRINPEKVASLSLQAPVIDLETHYQLNASDRVSMEAAYGGSFSAFLSAMPTWNPMRHQRRYELRDYMWGRMHIWASPTETSTAAYIRLPGGTGNSVYTPDHNRLDITGDIDIRWFGSADNWASGAEQNLVSKWSSLGAHRSWRFFLNATGRPTVQISTDGTTTNTFTASVNPTVVNGQERGLRFTRALSSGLLTFYESTDGTNWVQLGTTQNVLAGQSIFAAGARLECGAHNSGGSAVLTGTVKRIQIAGVTAAAGTVDLGVDFTTKIGGSRYVVDDSGDFIWQLRGTTQLIGGSVTQQFASAVVATYGVLGNSDPIMDSPATLIDPAVAKDTGWTQQLAMQQTAKWMARRRDNTLTTDWCGADGFHSIPLPDGRVLWTFSDTLTGTVNSDGSRSGAVMINNSLVIEEADGTIGETIHASGNSGAALLPVEVDHYYWLNDGIVEQENGDDVIRLFAYDSRHVPGGWEILGIHLLTLDINTFAILSRQPRATTNATWNNFLERPDYTYVCGYKADWILARPVLARAPAGQITGQWEYWNGSGWTTDEAQVAYLRDSDGNLIEGDWDMYYHNGKYMMSSKDGALWGNAIELWSATSPQGPYTKYYEHTIPEQTSERFGAITTCYGSTLHPQIPASPGKIMGIYCVNGWESEASPGQGVSVNDVDASVYQARFVELPLPD